MKISVQEFKDLVESLEMNGVDVHFRGEYHGRFFYEGIGVDVENLAVAAEIVAELKYHGYDLGSWDHQDNMGLGFVVAWRTSKFEAEEAEETNHFGEEFSFVSDL